MKTILLVEDDKKISTALGYRLQSMGYKVESAMDAIYAMNETIRCRPDVILLDINLPGGDGFIVADRIRASTKVATTPVIFITASKSPEFRKRAEEFGAAGYLEKPFGVAELTEAIDVCLSQQGVG